MTVLAQPRFGFDADRERAERRREKRKWCPPADLPRVLLDRPAWVGEGMAPARRFNLALTTARRILWAARDYFRPVKVFACYSGGYDSAAVVVMALTSLDWWGRLRTVDVEVLHINTGIGIEATRQFVRDFCWDRGIPFREVRTPESYEDWVLENGFPGPAMHATMYQRLKERAIRVAVAEAKEGHPRNATVMLVSGIRHDESMIRAGYQRCVSKVDSQVWINPLYWSTVDDLRLIREVYGLPRNPVKDRLGMSGECVCGAYSEPGELLRIEMTCPATAAYLRDLERRVRERGYDWGWEDPGAPESRKGRKVACGVYTPDEDDFRPMCASCEKTKLVPMSLFAEG